MFEINGRKIGVNNEPYIIAELSANHNGSIDRAKESIRVAKDCGAHAVKLQSYTADTMTIDCDKPDFMVKGGLWDGYKLYDLYGEACTPYAWHKILFSYAREIGITIFSTPFDESAVELLEDLNTPAYKIASFELTDLPLIKLVAQQGKPLLMSTGMANEEEIREAVKVAYENGCNSLLLFHCVSSYPAPIESSNLKKIANLRREFDIEVGLSDHTLDNTAAIASIAFGATAIEKHFTINRSDKGPDSAFSIEPNELVSLVKQTKDSWLALGGGNYARPAIEDSSLAFRRSIYFVNNLKAGQIVTQNDIRRIRPGFGLPPKFFEDIIGKSVLCDVERGDAVTWDVISHG